MAATDDALAAADARAAPAVVRRASSWALPAGIVGVVALGIATFAGLYQPSTERSATGDLPITTRAPSTSADLPAPPVLAPVAPPPPVETYVPPSYTPPPPAPAPAPVAAEPPRQNTPALLIDLTAGEKPPVDPAAATATAAAAGRAATGPNARLSTAESFAARIGQTAPETVGTDRMNSTNDIVAQGTVITAVLETAINSDLPGLVRAVVSRDVRGFDGSKILIPRGSRLIGQYSNGVALGQSRAFVIWTRLLRSDGVSVQLGSAATDPLGTAGIGGKVNTHFLRRFGTATLLSVITSGLDILTRRNNQTAVIVGSSQQANQLAGIALQREIDIPPTIKVAQGTPVRVFVAKDLDFDPNFAERAKR